MGKRLSKIEKFRKIVREGQMAHIDGVQVDGMTAAAVVKVYDALNPENQEKLMALPVHKIADIVWKLIK